MPLRVKGSTGLECVALIVVLGTTALGVAHVLVVGRRAD